ncbi:ral guanine nucleotide dissociation stimulator-like isoform X2 [Dipodomys spectabilis]|uniref:ral guanine nucleotide dissociation stimulator-like isoform X2 n=1 Tax=Dipodomys spectabilis TaxID=105255 RepID=UPI001C53761A|nr:ral guanine nucleotide dissociation stimulator-like isoform X2 [Dipodomys spectabilis]
MHPDPWDCCDMGDLQISSREPALISMMESDHDEDTAHVLERLPDLKVKQLSLMAVKLFKGLIPEQCLTYLYAQPDHEEGLEHLAPTVLAILEHCEKLHTCVISTCLGDHSTEAAERAQVLEHWIDVALEYPEGTVPYLGTILTHLASLHKDKHSKDEYKLIALMKKLQRTCEELHVVPDMNFVSWFNNMNNLGELESSKLSRELEPPRRAGFLSWNNKRSPPLRKSSRNSQASSRELSSNSSSQLETCEQLSSGSGSHTPSLYWGCSPKPCAHCNPLYQSAPNICGANMMTEDEGILPYLSSQTSSRTGHRALS